MAFHGKHTGVILGGYNLTRFLRDIAVNQATEPVDATGFQAAGKEYVVGMSDATVSTSGMYDGALPAIQATFEDVQGSDSNSPFLVALSPTPWLLGSRVRMGQCKSTGFDVGSGIGDLVSISGGFNADGGLRGGVLLAPVTPLSVSTNGPTLDTGAASAAGGRLQVHVMDNSRTANTTLVVQHSTNGSTWVDLQLVPVVAAGLRASHTFTLAGTINRYLRINSTLTAGTGQVSYTAALARN